MSSREPIPLSHYQARRARLARALAAHPAALAAEGPTCAVLFSTPAAVRNHDVEHLYRADSDVGWLTGFAEPETVVVLRVEPDGAHRFTLFLRPRDRAREIWTGRRLGPERAAERLATDEAFPIGDLERELPRLLWGCTSVFTHTGRREADDLLLLKAITLTRSRTRRKGRAPGSLVDITPTLAELRWLKDPLEVGRMEAAGRASMAGHRRAMARCAPGRTEADLEAELAYAFRLEGGRGHAYNPIVAAGANACILHYEENDAELKDGDLVLIDAGAEVDLYAADITRTFPVNGRFSAPQRELYEIVLQANLDVIAAAGPGQSLRALDDVARRTLARGLLDLGLLSGSIDEVLERKRTPDDPPWHPGRAELERFYMHGTGHYLGLDVHDAGPYHDDGEPRGMPPGVAFTVEPGLYVAPDDEAAPAEFRGLGIRIEDDVLVTDTGVRVLTADLPKEPRALEELVGAER